MSLLNRFLPHALCCFYPPRDLEDDETRPSTAQDPQYTVARKPVPYAMVNVPHQPDIADEQAFRRMLTASPACPIEAGPISNAQQRQAHRRRKKEPSKLKSAPDLDCSLNSGSPAHASSQTDSRNPKQKASQPRLNKKSSKGKSRETDADRAEEHCNEIIYDTTAAKPVDTTQPTGLVDILTPRDTSRGGYDSDAKVIKTPEFDNAGTTTRATPETRANLSKDPELMPTDSVSNNIPSPLSVKARTATSPKRLARSSPYPCTPEKISFTEALQPNSSEPPDVVLKRLSAGIANGSIKPPTDLELRTLKGPVSHDTQDDWKTSLQAPLRWSSLKKEPNTPQTVIRRLSDMVQCEEKERLDETSSRNRSESKRASLLTQLEPALLEYLSRFSEMQSLDLTLHDGKATPETVVKDADTSAVEHKASASSETKLQDKPCAETMSITSILPSEHNSVHLFNMNIPTRLESKSNATIFSPAVSTNASKRSLDPPQPVPAVTRNSPIRHVPPFGLGRAEHNRKPSDPQTRHIFEVPGRRYHPYWKTSTTSVAQWRTSPERDDASSVYSADHGIQSKGEMPYLTSSLSVRKNVNSFAIGGRSASTEIPVRRSSRAYSSTMQALERSPSATEGAKSDRLDAATEVISRYLDGKNENDIGNDDRYETPKRASPETSVSDLPIPNNRAGPKDVNAIRSIDVAKAHPLGAEEVTSPEQHLRPQSLESQNNTTNIARGAGNGQYGMEAPATLLKESATDMWNRAYREARADSQAKDFLPKSNNNDDELRLSPSYTSLRLPRRSNSILRTPQSTLRRSQSAGPDMRTSFRSDMATKDRNTINLLTKTMKRLSFWQLKPQRQQDSLSTSLQKPPMAKDDRAKKRKSSTTFDIDRAVNLRAAHTPPLSQYLGLWGSFPSHERAERTGPAGETDHVLTRNFGAEQMRESLSGSGPATLRSRLSANTLSIMQNKSKKIFSTRANKLDRNKTKSMSPGTPSHRIEKNQGLLLKRWQRQNRVRSSEWRGCMTTDGHRSSISSGRPVEYPELHRASSGVFLNESPRESSPFYKVESTLSESATRPGSDSNGTDKTSKMTNAATQTSERQDVNKSSTWESITFANMSESDIRSKENFNMSRVSSEGWYSPVQRVSNDAAATFPRTSKDLKMPGSFEAY